LHGTEGTAILLVYVLTSVMANSETEKMKFINYSIHIIFNGNGSQNSDDDFTAYKRILTGIFQYLIIPALNC